MKLKYILFISVFSLILNLISPCFAANSKNNSNNIIKSEENLESILNISKLTIDDYIPFDMIYSLYEKQCDEEVISEVKTLTEDLNRSRTKGVKNSKYVSTMKLRFSIFQKMLTKKNDKGVDYFCKKNYLAYHIMQLSQDSYLNKTNKTLNKSNTSTLHNSAKSQDSISLTKTNKNIESGTKYITLNSNISGLSSDELSYYKTAEDTIQKEIGNLLELNLLTQSDLKILDNKITINYNKTCENTEGSFHILKSKDGSIVQFKSIILNINLCDSTSFKNNYTNYIKQIFIHEISHYIYTFTDSHTDEFSNICWNGKKLCTKDSFVSNYSTSSSAEDYAESFAYRYLDNFNGVDKTHNSSSDQYLIKKLEHFSTLIQILN